MTGKLHHLIPKFLQKSFVTRTDETDQHLLADLIHQIAAPIHSASINARLVMDELNQTELRQRVSAIYTACRQAEVMLRNAATVRRAMTDEAFFDIRPINLETLKKVITDVFKVLDTLKANRNPYRLNLQELARNSNLWIKADLELLEHAIWNVVENAFVYSYHGRPVEIDAKILPNNKLQLDVKNMGVDISEEEIQHCTDRGRRGRTATMVHNGRGLGLWVVSRAMQVHDGEFRLSSAYGLTTATILLPLAR